MHGTRDITRRTLPIFEKDSDGSQDGPLMTETDMVEDLQYPIGQFDKSMIDRASRDEYLHVIADAPKKLAYAIEGLDETQIETQYRRGGWTIRQVIHHLGEAHLNGFYRIKMTLTEDSPMIVPYDASKWAELGDQTLTIDPSLKIFEGVHSRLSAIFQDLSDSQFERKAINLESGEWTVEGFLALYAWHARHHTAHITNLRERNGW
jgi:hypothetical protein